MLGLGINRMWSGLKSADGYAVNSLSPKLAFDFDDEYYRTNGGQKSFSNAMTFARAGLATMVDGYGSELITNGTFTNNVDGWTATLGNIAWNDGRLNLLGNGVNAYPRASQDVTTIIGKLYVVEFNFEFVVAGITVEIDGTAISGGAITSSGKYSFSFIATDTTSNVQFKAINNVNANALLDNISVREAPVIKWAPHNLLSYSEQFDNAGWSKGTNVTVTPNYAEAPDGTISADRIVMPDDAQTYIQQAFTKSNGASYVGAVWARATSGTDSFGLVIDGQTETKNVTETWQLFTKEITATSSGGAIFQIDNNAEMDILFWGAHLYRSDLGGMVNNPDRGDSYVPTTSSAVYLPRRGHHKYNGDQWVNKGILVESEARTNLITYSNDFNNADWKGYFVKPSLTGGQIAPDGSTTAVKWNASTTTGAPAGTIGGLVFGQGLAVSGTVYTASVWLKASTSTLITLGLDDGIQKNISLTTEWVRYSYTGAAGANLRLFQLYEATNDDIDIYVWGAQTEQASTPSSYIPTNGASVTRAAETVTVPYANLPWPTPTYIGNELVTNGTFDTDTSGWTLSNATTQIVSNEVEITSTVSFGGIYQDFPTEVGKVYEFSITSRKLNAFQARARVYNASSVILATLDNTTTSNLDQSIAFVATSSTSRIKLEVGDSTAGRIVYFDNISVREINPLSVSIAMMGEMDFADEGGFNTAIHMMWRESAGNEIQFNLSTNSTETGSIYIYQDNASVRDQIKFTNSYVSGLSVPFNIAGRHGSTFINGAVDGISATADTTPIALVDLSTTDLRLAYDYLGTVSEFRMWDKDLGDTGIAEATKPSTEPSLSLTFDGQPSSFTNTGLTS